MAIYYIVNGIKVDPEGRPIVDEPTAPSPKEFPLPDSFPERDKLTAAGYTTLEAVKAIEDLTAIDGIGKAAAAKIRSALSAFGAL